MTDDYDDVEKNKMMVMVVNAIHWMIRKGPIDNIIETLDEKGGEIGINGQNGHLWLFDHQNIILFMFSRWNIENENPLPSNTLSNMG